MLDKLKRVFLALFRCNGARSSCCVRNTIVNNYCRRCRCDSCTKLSFSKYSSSFIEHAE